MAPTLKVNFAGVEMPNPFMLSSAPPTTTVDMVADAFRQGWGGAVLKTMAYDVNHYSNVTPRITAYKDGDEILGFTNCEICSPHTVEEWAEDTRRLKKEWPDRGVFVSLLHTEGLVEHQWREVTRLFNDTGCDGFELNFSCSHGMAEAGGGAQVGSRDDLVEMVARWVTEETTKPVMVKLPAMAYDLPGKGRAAQRAGASAIAAINTLNSLPGIDLDSFVPMSSVGGYGALQGLSGRAIKPVALRSVAQIAQGVDLPISGCGGIYKWQDAAEFIAVGSGSLQVCSSVMEYGYRIITDLCEGLLHYMDEKGFETIYDFMGKALPNLKKHNDLPRSYRVKAVSNDKCIGCGRCVLCCRDNGYQAIELDETRHAVVDPDKCDGCGLCAGVCPVTNCMTMQLVGKEALA